MDLQTKNKYNVCLIGLDISEEELQNNELLDERIISDAQFNLGVPDNSIDIVVSRFVCEHMDNPRNFYKLAYRALKPGGMMMNLIPNPIAPHYMANYLLPHTISKSIVPVLVPGRKYTGVFKTFYKECTPRANERAIRECGDFRTTLYYGDSGAFYMILPPIYLCYLVWGWFWNVLGIRIFNDNFFIVAIKSGGDLG
jgi:ubiquinone/menaquinone biosynthesis C-methylase UbiE